MSRYCEEEFSDQRGSNHLALQFKCAKHFKKMASALCWGSVGEDTLITGGYFTGGGGAPAPLIQW